MTDKVLGHATAYGYYKAGGGTMTEAEFTEFMADFGTASQTAVEAAQAALASKNAAQTAATTATTKASEATTAATTATNKAAEAQADADAAALDASQAMSAASTATTKATEATTAAATAVSAKDDAVSANTAAQSAKTAAQTAQTGAETAAASVQASAAQIQTNADDISELKEDLTTLAPKEDMFKAFPTDTATGSVASFADGANVPVKSLIVNIDPVQSGSGDPSPTNVRPISGWSEVNVEHTGKNLFNKASVQNSKWLSTTTGEAENATASYCVSEYIPVKANEPVHIPNTASSRRWFYDATKTPKTYLSNSSTQTFTPTEDGFIRVTVNIDQSEGVSIDAVQIEYGSSATAYEPYSGQSINIQLGQTVYGGTLDVTGGVLTVDRACTELSESWFWFIGNTQPTGCTVCTTTSFPDHIGQNGEELCSHYSISTDPYIVSMPYGSFLLSPTGISAYFCFKNESGGTVQEFKDYIVAQRNAGTPIQVEYALATPITVQLTPHEVTALLGSNNVWADTGDTEVTYRADPTLYISRLTEPDADMVADANITSGQYFMVGNTLYKATANIASGGAITPNVNCVRKSLSEALNELNA